MESVFRPTEKRLVTVEKVSVNRSFFGTISVAFAPNTPENFAAMSGTYGIIYEVFLLGWKSSSMVYILFFDVRREEIWQKN